MLTALACHPGDLAAAQRLAEWIRDLGGAHGHSLFLIRDSRIDLAQAQALKDVFLESFGFVVMLDFTDHYKKWPQAPGAAFSMIARHIGSNSKEPWLWCEPDCVCLRPGWLDAIEHEYKTVALPSGKVFMGCFVPGIQTSPDHCSGIAVYPGEVIRHAGNALIAGDRAWDLAAASQIVPKCHFTKLISHTWRRQSFQTQEEVNVSVPAEAVLYHSSKDGSLIRLLRERMNLPGHASGQSIIRESAVESLSGMTPPHVPQSTDGGILINSDTSKNCKIENCTIIPASGSQTETTREAGASDAGTPWADKDRSLGYIQTLATQLKLYCTAPRNTATVRAILEETGVIGHVAKKRRRKRK